MSKPLHTHCYSCGCPIYYEDGQELPAMNVLLGIEGPAGMGFIKTQRPICEKCADERAEALVKAKEEMEAAQARARLVTARPTIHVPGKGGPPL